jgi:molecular chaperone HscA
MALLQISEPGQSPDPHQRRVAVGIDLGTTHSLVAAVRHGVAECLPDDAGARAAALGGALPRRAGAGRSASRRATAQAEDAENTLSSTKRFMGRKLADIAGPSGCRTASSTSPGMVADCQTRDGEKTPVEVSRPRSWPPAPARRGHLRRRALRRRHHRAGLLRRCAAAGHQGRGATRRAERAAPDQRADRRGGGLRAGPRQRRPLCGLRPGRRHLRHLAAAPDRGVFEVVATGGDAALGGDDIDHALADWALAQAGVQTVSPQDKRAAWWPRAPRRKR